MPLLVSACAAWLRRHAPWFPDRQTWREGLIALFLLAAVILLALFGSALLWWQRALGLAVLLLALAISSRRGFVKLLGPLLFYDLVRSTRRGHYLVLRCLYAFFLLTVLFFLYAFLVFGWDFNVREVFSGVVRDPHILADFAAYFFLAFLVVQFAAASLLTPVCTAGAITEEKDSRSLEFLFTTDLRNREIVLSLAVSRLAQLLLLLLTGLPVVCLMQFLGGVDPTLLWGSFAMTGITMISLTALGILVSVYSQHSRQAVLRTYGWATAYLVTSGLSWLLLAPLLGWASFPSTASWTSPVTLTDLVTWVNLGNPGAVAFYVVQAVSVGRSLDSVLPGAVASYAWWHGLFALVCLAWAVARVRVVTLRPVPLHVRGALPGTAHRRWRPRLAGPPLLWKELFAEPGQRRGRVSRIVAALLLPLGFLPALGIIYFHYLTPRAFTVKEELSDPLNIWVRGVGTLVAVIMLLAVAARAAASIASERQRGTLDSLLSTPLSTRSILFAKWFGSIASTRWDGIKLGLMAALALALGGLSSWAVPVLLGAWLLFAGFFAALGLWFSVRCHSPQRALLGTLLATIGFSAGHWLIWILLSPIISWLKGPEAAVNRWMDLQALGLTPPLTLAFLAFPGRDSAGRAAGEWAWAVDPLWRGAVFWALGTLVFWSLANARFRGAANRAGERQNPRWQALMKRLERLPRAAALVHRAARAPYLRAALIGGLGLALLFWYIKCGDTGAIRLQEAIARADDLDPHWRLDELEEHRMVVPDDQNGALQVPIIPNERSVRRGRWCPEGGFPSQEALEAFGQLAPEVQLDAWQLQILTDELEGVEQAVMQARCMVHFPRGRNPITYSQDGVSTLLPHVQRLRHIAQVLSYDAIMRAQEGDVDGALESCRGAINAGRVNGDEPVLVSMLVRLACTNLALAQIERSLAQGEPSLEALADLQTLLEEEAKDNPFLTGMRGERALFDRLMGTIETGSMSGTNMRMVQGLLRGNLSWTDRLSLWTGVSLRRQRAALVDFATLCVEAAKLPAHEAIDALAELETRAGELPGLARALISGDWKGSVYKRVSQSFHRNEAYLRCAVVLAALERFRHSRRHWPDALGELVPEFLAAVPLDPYDGQPLRYARISDGVVVYSVGPDRTDDGGKLKDWPPRARTTEELQGLDLGFRLWDLAQRRQAPTKSTSAAGPAATR
jgi:ABC-type Na+ efflux pump permease subunit